MMARLWMLQTEDEIEALKKRIRDLGV